eukprot:3756056-Pyramimonas_sp.AAC.1
MSNYLKNNHSSPVRVGAVTEHAQRPRSPKRPHRTVWPRTVLGGLGDPTWPRHPPRRPPAVRAIARLPGVRSGRFLHAAVNKKGCHENHLS